MIGVQNTDSVSKNAPSQTVTIENPGIERLRKSQKQFDSLADKCYGAMKKQEPEADFNFVSKSRNSLLPNSKTNPSGEKLSERSLEEHIENRK